MISSRDFNPNHIQKWQGKHWLFGFYFPGGKKLKYCLYGSPDKMKRWIQEKANYIMSDYKISEVVPEQLTLENLYEILGKKDLYTLNGSISFLQI